jgi:ABC-type antimicrobial peptide transport system permease subunit
LAEFLLGRLRPGVSLEQAEAQITPRWPAVLAAAVPDALPPSERAQLRDSSPRVQRIGTGTSGLRDRYLQPVTLIFGLTSLLLLLACVNLSGLLLARLAARRAELSVRVALGGTSWRIARQIPIENLLLSLAGSVLALPVAYAATAALRALISPITWRRRWPSYRNRK